MEDIIRILLLLLGVLFTVSATLYALFAHPNAGFFASLALGVIFLASSIFWAAFSGLPLWIRVAYYVCILLLLGPIFFTFTYGRCNTVTYKEDAVLVLGARLKGDQIPSVLALRLEKAIEYHRKNPNAIIILSGGGSQAVYESEAMKGYMLARGVSEDCMITEELSANTKENFTFCKEIISARLVDGCSVAFITSGYHVLRSALMAKAAGLNLTRLSASSPLHLLLPDLIRECMGLLRFILLGY